MATTTQRARRPAARAAAAPSPPIADASSGDKPDRCDSADLQLVGLVRTIEREIIPRLVLAHRDAEPPPARPIADAGTVGKGHVAELCDLVVRSELDELMRYVQRTRARGVPLECIYLELLAPVARRLGEMWLADECDFTTVTLGLWRLHQVLHELAPAFQFDGDPVTEGKRVLLASNPGEQHTFGLFMVAEFFRRAGWDVIDGPAFSARELAAAVRHDWFSVAGFSLSCEGGFGRLADLIRDVRQASRNRAIGIIVGGAVFAEHPDLIGQVGADGGASDGREAVRLAESLVGPREQRRLG
jgi:methanogenic corrinoid protein MtbC1